MVASNYVARPRTHRISKLHFNCFEKARFFSIDLVSNIFNKDIFGLLEFSTPDGAQSFRMQITLLMYFFNNLIPKKRSSSVLLMKKICINVTTVKYI